MYHEDETDRLHDDHLWGAPSRLAAIFHLNIRTTIHVCIAECPAGTVEFDLASLPHNAFEPLFNFAIQRKIVTVPAHWLRAESWQFSNFSCQCSPRHCHDAAGARMPGHCSVLVRRRRLASPNLSSATRALRPRSGAPSLALGLKNSLSKMWGQELKRREPREVPHRVKGASQCAARLGAPLAHGDWP